jgi:hypothetical protein
VSRAADAQVLTVLRDRAAVGRAKGAGKVDRVNIKLAGEQVCGEALVRRVMQELPRSIEP